MAQHSIMPLSIIKTVVFDTETTSLDTKRARIIQIGGVRFSKGLEGESEIFDEFVKPDQDIPAASSKIHGISNRDVENAHTFGEVFKNFEDFCQDAVLVGHSVGFDMAIFKQEATRHSIQIPNWRVLCIRHLAEALLKNLPDYSLDTLANYFKVEVKNRHNALGDALVTAAVYQKLVEVLRDRGVRSLASAESICLVRQRNSTVYQQGGWDSIIQDPMLRFQSERSQSVMQRIDSYPFRHRVKDIMSHPPHVVDPDKSVKAVLGYLVQHKISSVFVAPGAASKSLPLAGAGIVTERDLLRAIDKHATEAFDMKVGDFSSSPLISVPEQAYVYRAIGRMRQTKVRHMAVADGEQNLVGALTVRDLLKLRAEGAVMLGDEIDHAKTPLSLSEAWAKLPGVVESLLQESVPVPDISGVISRELGALTRRATQLAEQDMIENGRGRPPTAYAILLLGSGAREDTLLSGDQDHAMIYQDGGGEKADEYFAELGKKMSDILNIAGLEYCKGGLMSSNPQWRGSISEWKQRVKGWFDHQSSENMLRADAFFDQRCVFGDTKLHTEIFSFIHKTGSQHIGSFKLMAAEFGHVPSSINMFGSIKSENGRIDLKRAGMFQIVLFARLLAVRYGSRELATARRLQALIDLDIGGQVDLKNIKLSYQHMQKLVLMQQVLDAHTGVNPSSKVLLNQLSSDDKEELKKSLGHIEHMAELAMDMMFT